MKLTIAGLFCCAALYLPSLAQNTSGAGGTSDQDFVTLAAQTDMAEANLGQLAETNASSQGVKDLAQMLVTDHTSDYNQITTVATKAGLTVPKGLDKTHEKMSLMFQKLKGAAFDHRYVAEMVKGHEAAIAAYDKEARDGQNADLKAYAKNTLPTLEKHRTAAQALVKGGGAKKTAS